MGEESEKKKFECLKCGSVFKTSAGLYNHQTKLKYPCDQPVIHKCDLCERTFRNNTGLKNHLRGKPCNERKKPKEVETVTPAKYVELKVPEEFFHRLEKIYSSYLKNNMLALEKYREEIGTNLPIRTKLPPDLAGFLIKLEKVEV